MIPSPFDGPTFGLCGRAHMGEPPTHVIPAKAGILDFGCLEVGVCIPSGALPLGMTAQSAAWSLPAHRACHRVVHPGQ